MRLSAPQVKKIAEISDGFPVTVNKVKGSNKLTVHRLAEGEKEIRVDIDADGEIWGTQVPKGEGRIR